MDGKAERKKARWMTCNVIREHLSGDRAQKGNIELGMTQRLRRGFSERRAQGCILSLACGVNLQLFETSTCPSLV